MLSSDVRYSRRRKSLRKKRDQYRAWQNQSQFDGSLQVVEIAAERARSGNAGSSSCGHAMRNASTNSRKGSTRGVGGKRDVRCS